MSASYIPSFVYTPWHIFIVAIAGFVSVASCIKYGTQCGETSTSDFGRDAKLCFFSRSTK